MILNIMYLVIISKAGSKYFFVSFPFFFGEKKFILTAIVINLYDGL